MQYTTKITLVSLDQDEYHPILVAKINRHTVRAVLDTGASHSCLDLTFMKSYLPEVQITPKECLTAGVGGQGFDVQIADIPNFRIGHFKLPVYSEMAILDLNYINMAYTQLHMKPIQLILGNDFFVKYLAIIDYSQRTFYFTANDHDR